MKNKVLRGLAIVFLLSLNFVAISPAHAIVGTPADCGSSNLQPDPNTGLCVPANTANSQVGINDLIVRIINILLSVAAIIAVLFIIIGGFMYITSAGNAEQAEKGRNTLVNAIIGLVIIILAFVIVGVVNNAFADRSLLNFGGF